MKKFLLPHNNKVAFNEEEHTYTLADGTSLSGITSIIHKYLFPCMYDGVSDTVMQAARDRGHKIHKALEGFLFHGVAYRTDWEYWKELESCGKLFRKNKMKPVVAEYLVSDNETVATCIDAVVNTKEGIVLIDYKTTSQLYTEYLQWQLSIEAYLFEMQTGEKVDKLYAIHLPKNKEAKIVEITRLPDKYVQDIILAQKNDELLFDNPLHKLSDDTDKLLKQYLDAEVALLELNESVKYYTDIQTDIKEKLKGLMDEESASVWENDEVKITRGKDSVRKIFKLDLLKEKATEPIKKWLDSNIDKCYTDSLVSGKVTIKFK